MTKDEAQRAIAAAYQISHEVVAWIQVEQPPSDWGRALWMAHVQEVEDRFMVFLDRTWRG